MKKAVLLGAWVCLVPPSAVAYDTDVHAMITGFAANRSVLNERLADYGLNLGVSSVDDLLPSGYYSRVAPGVPAFTYGYSVKQWMMLGAIREDASLRFLNHFYNPLAAKDHEGLLRFNPSLDWALGQTNAADHLYSLRSAKDYLYRGLLEKNPRERERNLSLFFQALGHVVHLVQDLAQPEHTREDPHPLSVYEAWTLDHFKTLSYFDYPVVSLGAPENYWTTCGRGSKCPEGKGLADYSNRGFVTTDTNFQGTVRNENLEGILPARNLPRPDGQGGRLVKPTPEELEVGPLDSAQALHGQVWFIETPVVDSYQDGLKQKALTSTFSLFDEDLKKKGTKMTFTFNAYNANSLQQLLIPRAVGYSAGLINYFLRGQIKISLPAKGPYAYADHASATGFSSLRATLENATPGEHFKGGSLTAVVKFHRNTCYAPDLSGEFSSSRSGGQPIPPGNGSCTLRTELESMTVAKVDGVTLRSREAREFTFQFAEEIPLGATDVYLQVVYRGPLGPDDATRVETDGLAVGARDLSEPSYYTVHNSTDLYAVTSPQDSTQPYHWEDFRDFIKQAPYSIVDRNKNQQYDGPPQDHDVSGDDLACTLTLRNERVAIWPVVPAGRFARIAVLIDSEGVPGTLRVVGGKGIWNDQNVYIAPKSAQWDWKRGRYVVSTATRDRGYYQFGVHFKYHLHPYTPPLLDSYGIIALASRAENKEFPVAMDPQSPAGAPFLLAQDVPLFSTGPTEGTATLASEPAAPRAFVLDVARR